MEIGIISLLVTVHNVEHKSTYDYFFIRKYFYTPQTFLKTNLVVSNISTYILRFFFVPVNFLPGVFTVQKQYIMVNIPNTNKLKVIEGKIIQAWIKIDGYWSTTLNVWQLNYEKGFFEIRSAVVNCTPTHYWRIILIYDL